MKGLNTIADQVALASVAVDGQVRDDFLFNIHADFL
jgi:hypothetical protein